MLRACRDCGDQFEVEPGEFWKIRCLSCWVDLKHAESDGRRLPANHLVQHTRPDVVQENAVLRRQVARLEADIDELEAENGQLRRQLSEVVGRLHRAGSLAAEFHENLPRLLQLCHPDRHDGSPASLKATRWLLEMRRSAPVFETEEVPS